MMQAVMDAAGLAVMVLILVSGSLMAGLWLRHQIGDDSA